MRSLPNRPYCNRLHILQGLHPLIWIFIFYYTSQKSSYSSSYSSLIKSLDQLSKSQPSSSGFSYSLGSSSSNCSLYSSTASSVGPFQDSIKSCINSSSSRFSSIRFSSISSSNIHQGLFTYPIIVIIICTIRWDLRIRIPHL